MSKKDKKNKGTAPAAKASAVKATEPKAVEAPKAEVPKVEAPKRPEMPGNFCMEKADWEGNGICYDPKSNGCKACAKDKEFAETVAACKARAEFLVLISKKAPKAAGERKARTGGGAVQTFVIDDAIKAKLTMPEIVKIVAEKCYSGDEKGAASRIKRHIKSIKDGFYVRSSEMLPHLAHLEKKAA